MRSPIDMTTIQIEITNACPNSCGNCTRFVGHSKHPFFMDFETFKTAVDSMVGLPKHCLVGIMGGEPLLSPDFEKMCEYALTKFSKEQLGLWTCFPPSKEHYREVIVRTFGNIFLNDHTRADIMHKPILVQPDELPMEAWERWRLIDNCWAQMSWSASINPHGAFFCEIAASLSMLLNKKTDKDGNPLGWEVEPGWWTRSPLHFTSQIKEFCTLCGLAMPLQKRSSTDIKDDISPAWVERLSNISPKVMARKYELHNLQLCKDERPMAAYKDAHYRDKIAARYGMFLMINERSFQTPYLSKKWKGAIEHITSNTEGGGIIHGECYAETKG